MSDNEFFDENEFEEIKNNNKGSNTTVAISSVDDTISIHTNIFDIKDKNLDCFNVLNENPINRIYQSKIIDLPKLTQKLNTHEIKLLCAKTLDRNVELSENEINSLSKKEDSCSSNDEFDTFLDDVTYGLGSRNKHEKLTTDQIRYLKNCLSENNIKVKEISVAYSVSPTVLNKIKREEINEDNMFKEKQIIKVYGNNKAKLLKTISNLILTNDHTLTVKEIASYCNTKLTMNYSVNLIRNFIKNFTNFSFKRVKSRPSNIDLNKVQSCRKLFTIRFAQEITTKTLIINVDESSINRNVKTSYSWGLKGVPIECKNAPFIGSISCVMGICSNGAWISFLTKETIKSANFVWFLKVMKNWLKSHNNFCFNDTLILLDNASIHKSKEAKVIIEKLRCKVVYLPAYSPEFATIEMSFSILKRNLSKSCQKEKVNLSQRESLAKIHNSLSKIKSQTIKNLFSKFYKNIKSSIEL